jgi:hypothetical protein
MTPPDARARLAEQVERLEAAYETARRRLIEQVAHDPFVSHMAPEEMQDSNGRYLLLDVLTALVSARTVLAREDQERQRDSSREAVDRVAALARDMRTWCSPNGVALAYADQLAEAIIGAQGAQVPGEAFKTLEKTNPPPSAAPGGCWCRTRGEHG